MRPKITLDRAAGNFLPFQSSTEVGKSQYDTNITPYNEDQLNELRAKRQTTADKFGNGLVNMGTSAFTGALTSAVGLAYGGLSAIVNADPTKLWQNDFTNSIIAPINDWAKKEMPFYYSKAEQESRNPLKGFIPGTEGSGNFWFDKVLGNSGFTLGSMVVGFGLSKVMQLGKAAALGEETLAATAEDIIEGKIEKGLLDQSKLDLKQQLQVGLIMGNGESVQEAMSTHDETRDNLYKLRASGNPQYAHLTDERIEELAVDAANTNYLINLPVTGALDFMLLSKWVNPGSKIAATEYNKIAQETVEGVTKYVDTTAKVPSWKKALISGTENYAKGFAFEGGQEMAQHASNLVSQEFVKQHGTKNTDWFNSIVSGLAQGITETLTTKEGWEEGLIGGLTGGLFGIGEGRSERITREANTKAKVDALNNFKWDELTPRAQSFIAANEALRQSEDALKSGDLFEAKNKEHEAFINFIDPLIKTGGADILKEKLAMLKQADLKEFNAQFGFKENENRQAEVVDKLISKVSSAEKLYDNMTRLFGSFYKNPEDRALNQVLVDRAYKVGAVLDDIDEREKKITGEIKQFGVESLLMDRNAALSSDVEIDPVVKKDLKEIGELTDYNKKRKELKDSYRKKYNESVEKLSSVLPTSALEIKQLLGDLNRLAERRENFIQYFNELQDPEKAKLRFIKEALLEAKENKKNQPEAVTSAEDAKEVIAHNDQERQNSFTTADGQSTDLAKYSDEELDKLNDSLINELSTTEEKDPARPVKEAHLAAVQKEQSFRNNKEKILQDFRDRYSNARTSAEKEAIVKEALNSGFKINADKHQAELVKTKKAEEEANKKVQVTEKDSYINLVFKGENEFKYVPLLDENNPVYQEVFNRILGDPDYAKKITLVLKPTPKNRYELGGKGRPVNPRLDFQNSEMAIHIAYEGKEFGFIPFYDMFVDKNTGENIPVATLTEDQFKYYFGEGHNKNFADFQRTYINAKSFYEELKKKFDANNKQRTEITNEELNKYAGVGLTAGSLNYVEYGKDFPKLNTYAIYKNAAGHPMIVDTSTEAKQLVKVDGVDRKYAGILSKLFDDVYVEQVDAEGVLTTTINPKYVSALEYLNKITTEAASGNKIYSRYLALVEQSGGPIDLDGKSYQWVALTPVANHDNMGNKINFIQNVASQPNPGEAELARINKEQINNNLFIVFGNNQHYDSNFRVSLQPNLKTGGVSVKIFSPSFFKDKTDSKDFKIKNGGTVVYLNVAKSANFNEFLTKLETLRKEAAAQGILPNTTPFAENSFKFNPDPNSTERNIVDQFGVTVEPNNKAKHIRIDFNAADHYERGKVEVTKKAAPAVTPTADTKAKGESSLNDVAEGLALLSSQNKTIPDPVVPTVSKQQTELEIMEARIAKAKAEAGDQTKKAEYKREDFPEVQMRVDTPITQKLVNYLADVLGVPRINIADGKYVSWIKKQIGDFKDFPGGENLLGLDLSLNAPRQVFDGITKFAELSAREGKKEISDIEAKKADIEKRRQESLHIVTKENLDKGEDVGIRKNEDGSFEGEVWDNKNVLIENYKGTLEEVQNKINAKYDAELAALEATSAETKSEAPTVKVSRKRNTDSSNNNDPSVYKRSRYTAKQQIDLKRAFATLRSILPDSIEVEELSELEANVDKGIITFGEFKNSIIKLFAGAEKGTEYHEAFHAVFRTLLTREKQLQYYEAAKRDMYEKRINFNKAVETFLNLQPKAKDLTLEEVKLLVLEEYMADQMQEYAKNREANPRGILQKLWDQIRRFFDFFSKEKNLDVLFDRIYTGSFKKAKVIDRFASNFPLNGVNSRVFAGVDNDNNKVYLTQEEQVKWVNTVSANVLARLENNSNLSVAQLIENEISTLGDMFNMEDSKWDFLDWDNNVNISTKEKLKRLDAIFHTGEAKESFKAEILRNLAKFKLEEDDIFDNTDTNEGSPERNYERNQENVGGFGSLSSAVRRYIATTTYTSTVGDMLGLPEGTLSEPIQVACDPKHVYNGLAKICANQETPMQVLEIMGSQIKYDGEMSKFVSEFFKDTGLSYLPDGTIDVSGAFSNKIELIQRVAEAFHLDKVDYTFVSMDPSNKVNSVFLATRRDSDEVQLNTWSTLFLASNLSADQKAAQIESFVKTLTKERTVPYTALELEETVNKYKKVLDKGCISLSKGYLEYLLLTAPNTPRTPAQDRHVDKFRVSTSMTTNAAIENLQAIANVYKTTGNPFERGKVAEGDTGAVTRLLNMAKDNAIFDETVTPTSYTNAEGKPVYTFQKSTHHLTKIREIANSEKWNYDTLVEEAKTDPRKKYFLDNYLLAKPEFQDIRKNLEIIRIDGLRERSLNKDESGQVKTNVEGRETQGIVFGDFNDREFLISMYNLFTSGKNVIGQDGKIKTLRPTLITVMAESNTGDAIHLPVENFVDDSTGEILDSFVDAIFNEIQREHSRIQRVKNNEYKDEIINFNTPQYAANRGDKFWHDNQVILEFIQKTTGNSNLIQELINAKDIQPFKETLAAGIKRYFNQDFQEHLDLLEKEGIVSKSSDGYSAILLPHQYFEELSGKDKVFNTTNLVNNIKYVYLNNYINTLAINQLISDDPALGLKDFTDKFKRDKGENASGTNTQIALTNLEKELRYAIFGKDVLNSKGQLKFTDPADPDMDAQGYGTVELFRQIYTSLGRMTEQGNKLFDIVENGGELTYDQVKYLKENSIMLNSLKMVYYNGTEYIKLSIAPLTKAAHSIRLTNGKYVAQKGKEWLHDLRENMEKSNTHLTGPPSMSKKMIVNPVKMNENNSLPQIQGTNIHILDPRYFRLQQENPSNKTTIVDPTQMLQILAAEQDDSVVINGKTVGEIKRAYNKLLGERVDTSLIPVRAFVSKMQGGIRTPDFKQFVRVFRTSLENSGASDKLLAFTEIDAQGKPVYDWNDAAVVQKFEEMYTAHFNTAMKQKIPGYKATAQSDFGHEVIVDKNDNIIPTHEYLANREKYESSEYTTRRLKVREDGFAEVILPAHFKELFGLKEGQAIPQEIAKIFATRIPSQDKHSSIPCVIVDFLPAHYGSNIIVPVEFIKLTGSDFDIDSFFCHRMDHYVKYVKTESGTRVEKEVRTLFKSNEKLANSVYEALGYTGQITTEQKENALKRYSQYFRMNPDALNASDENLKDFKQALPELRAKEKVAKFLTYGNSEDSKWEQFKKWHTENNSLLKDLVKSFYEEKISDGTEKGRILKERTASLAEAINLKNNLQEQQPLVSSKESADLAYRISQLDEEIENRQEEINAMKDSLVVRALKQLELPSTEQEYTANPVKTPGEINNELLDYKIALHSNPHTLKEIAKTKATLTVIEESLDKLAINLGWGSADNIGKKYLTSSLNGLRKAFSAVKAGSNAIGAAVNNTQAYSVISKYGLTKALAKDEIPSSITYGNGKHQVTLGKISNDIKDSRVKLGRRIMDILSSLTSSMTDNAKHNFNERLGIDISSLGPVGVGVMHGIDLDVMINMINLEYVRKYLNTKKIQNISTSEEKKLQSGLRDSIIKNLRSAILNLDKNALDDLTVNGLSLNADDIIEALKTSPNSAQYQLGDEKTRNEIISRNNADVNYLVTNLKALMAFKEIEEMGEAIINFNKVVGLTKGLVASGDTSTSFAADDELFEALRKMNIKAYEENGKFKLGYLDPTKPTKYDFLPIIKEESLMMSNIKAVFDKNEIAKQAFVSKTKLVGDTQTAVMNSFTQKSSAVNRRKALSRFRRGFESHLNLLALRHEVIKSGKSFLNFAELLYGNEGAVYQVNEFIKRNPQYAQNTFLRAIGRRVDEKSGFNRIGVNTRTKGNAEFENRISDDFDELANTTEGQQLQKVLIDYLVAKDGLMFKNESFIKFIRPLYFKRMSKLRETYLPLLNTLSSQEFKDMFGKTPKELQDEYLKLFFRSRDQFRVIPKIGSGTLKEKFATINGDFINVNTIGTADVKNLAKEAFEPVYDNSGDETKITFLFPRYFYKSGGEEKNVLYELQSVNSVSLSSISVTDELRGQTAVYKRVDQLGNFDGITTSGKTLEEAESLQTLNKENLEASKVTETPDEGSSLEDVRQTMELLGSVQPTQQQKTTTEQSIKEAQRSSLTAVHPEDGMMLSRQQLRKAIGEEMQRQGRSGEDIVLKMGELFAMTDEEIRDEYIKICKGL